MRGSRFARHSDVSESTAGGARRRNTARHGGEDNGDNGDNDDGDLRDGDGDNGEAQRTPSGRACVLACVLVYRLACALT